MKISKKHHSFNEVKDKNIIRITLYYLIYIVCVGAGPERKVIDMLWESKGLNSVMERFYFVVENYPEVLYKGPLVILAMMVLAQTKKSFSRGVLFDGFHAIYSVYCDRFITNDKHFLWLREKIIPSFAALKIFHVDELQFTYVQRDNPPPRGMIIG